MTFYKKISRDINVNGKKRKDLPLNAEIFSYDEQVAKFVLTLTNDIDEINLSSAKTLAVMNYALDGENVSTEALSGVESVDDTSIYFIVPDSMRGFVGDVTAGVYIDLASGEKIDIQNLKFKMSRSLIDDASAPAAEIYFESFEDVLVKVKAAGDKAISDVTSEAQKVIDHADEKISEYDAKFRQSDTKMSELQNKQTELTSKFEESDVFNKAETSANVVYQLIGKEQVEMTFTLDFKNKVAESLVENPHIFLHGAKPALPLPEINVSESQIRYDNAKDLDGKIATYQNVTSNNMAFILFKYNIVEALKRELGEAFFVDRGAVTTAECAEIVRSVVFNRLVECWCSGGSPSGSKVNIRMWSQLNNAWLGYENSTSESITRLTMEGLENTNSHYICDDGFIYTLIYAEATDGVTPSVINLDYASLTFKLRISASEHIKSMIAQNHVQNVQPQITDLAARVLALETKLNQ